MSERETPPKGGVNDALELERRARPEAEARSLVLLLTTRHGGCELVRAILSGSPRYSIVGDADTPDEAGYLARRRNPDLILVAVDLADGPLADLIERLQRENPRSRMVTISETAEGVRQEELARNGRLNRILWRDVDKPRLESALGTASLGMRAESDSIAEAAPEAEPDQPAVRLSDLERAIITGCAEGKKQRDVAREQNVNERLVYRTSEGLRRRFGVKTMTELLARAPEPRLLG